MRSLCILIEVIGADAQEPRQFPDLTHIQMNDIAVHRHLSQVCRQICDPKLRHALLYQLCLQPGHNEMKLHRSGLFSHNEGSPLRTCFSEGGATVSLASCSFPRTDVFFRSPICFSISPLFAWKDLRYLCRDRIADSSASLSGSYPIAFSSPCLTESSLTYSHLDYSSKLHSAMTMEKCLNYTRAANA